MIKYSLACTHSIYTHTHLSCVLFPNKPVLPEGLTGWWDEICFPPPSKKNNPCFVCFVPSRSYVFSSLASAAVSFATGAFGMWIPLYLTRAQMVQNPAEACKKEICSSTDR